MRCYLRLSICASISRPVGLIIGLFTPLLGFFIVYAVLGHGGSLGSFVSSMQSSHDVASKVISLMALTNLVPFLLCNRRRLDATVKGIVIATMLYMVLYLYVKFVA